jgi:hypothetical protein
MFVASSRAVAFDDWRLGLIYSVSLHLMQHGI